ncbi:hypothetical protein MATL_G00255480 [Megalops atlanticus]|uniref:Uncharacterized protein n=1 Tax=Megalops atlanticus TaxID=7932 RepID=A0A9D3PD49_MEGAT|nr:hypothetical protein MATL_G00255480 [Megalops atlanticus]
MNDLGQSKWGRLEGAFHYPCDASTKNSPVGCTCFLSDPSTRWQPTRRVGGASFVPERQTPDRGCDRKESPSGHYVLSLPAAHGDRANPVHPNLAETTRASGRSLEKQSPVGALGS